MSQAVWIASYDPGMGDPIIYTPVRSLDDGIAFLAAQVSEADWDVYYASLVRTGTDLSAVHAKIEDNSEVTVLEFYFGLAAYDETRFVLEDLNGQVVQVPLWTRGDALSKI